MLANVVCKFKGGNQFHFEKRYFTEYLETETEKVFFRGLCYFKKHMDIHVVVSLRWKAIDVAGSGYPYAF